MKSTKPKKAFLFDMDGVLVYSNPNWVKYRQEILDVFEEEVAARVLDEVQYGCHNHHYFQVAQDHGSAVTEEQFYDKCLEVAEKIYAESEITSGLEEVFQLLHDKGFVVGIVSSSEQAWVDMLYARLPKKELISYKIGVNNVPGISAKPAPDGYIKAMKDLGVDADHTIVVEDSNPGLEAGKLSGAITIGFTEHLPEGYSQQGADMYVDSMEELKNWIEYLSLGEDEISLR